ncbi:septation ring formation regulator EzrA [Paucilactobacillus kaifaensis]|uniref:septation ring formation regulator EzrA n=1 Tax=Paucilactobacillus kaifaensis TaxID=2559921 RepID=UPI0010F51F27|nr:septation ring formation regulator EzrA [Paucilactobacillus kaifaensis]
MLQVLIGIVIVAAIIVGGLYLFQRITINQINDLQAAKQRLVGLHVDANLRDGATLSLTGESLNQFQQLQADYKEVNDHRFKEIDELADDIRRDVRGVNFVKVRQEVNQLRERVSGTEKIVNHTRDALSELQKIDQQHRQAVSKLEKKYQNLRKRLLSENFKFGASIDQLEEQLSTLEDEFDRFSTLTSEGDHAKAQDVLGGLEKNTNQLENTISLIPDLYQSLDVMYPEQLQELQAGYTKLNNQGYQFSDADIATEIANVDKQRTETLDKLAQLEIETVQKANENIQRQIDHLYAVMQKEIDARPVVKKLMDEMGQFITHAQNQNHELLIELDRLSQNYTLDHGELETARGLGEQIKQIEKNYQNDLTAVHQRTAVDSQVLEQEQSAQTTLTQIEKQQTQINDDVAGLQNDERRAKKTLQRFANEIHAIKRQVESLNLPGLPKSYLDYFFVVSDEIKKLDADINRIKINMEEITKQLLIVQADLETLQEKTNDIKDSARLAERLLQYANRLREQNSEIDAAATKAQKLFNESNDYAASLETIATVLDKVEPGAYKRLEDSYYKSSDDVEQKADLT